MHRTLLTSESHERIHERSVMPRHTGRTKDRMRGLLGRLRCWQLRCMEGQGSTRGLDAGVQRACEVMNDTDEGLTRSDKCLAV